MSTGGIIGSGVSGSSSVISQYNTINQIKLEIEALYAGYLDRQEADIIAFKKDETLKLPADIDYASIGGLSNEVRQKLEAARPVTLGQAGRIEGVTPAAIAVLLAWLRKRADRSAV